MANPPPTRINKTAEYETFRLWFSLPASFKNTFKKDPENAAEILGLEDEQLIELCQIPNRTAFSEKYGIDADTVTSWAKRIQEKDDYFDGIKDWMRRVTKNVVKAHYDKATKKFDPLSGELWYSVAHGYAKKTENTNKVVGLNDMIRNALTGEQNAPETKPEPSDDSKQ